MGTAAIANGITFVQLMLQISRSEVASPTYSYRVGYHAGQKRINAQKLHRPPLCFERAKIAAPCRE